MTANMPESLAAAKRIRDALASASNLISENRDLFRDTLGAAWTYADPGTVAHMPTHARTESDKRAGAMQQYVQDALKMTGQIENMLRAAANAVAEEDGRRKAARGNLTV